MGLISLLKRRGWGGYPERGGGDFHAGFTIERY